MVKYNHYLKEIGVEENDFPFQDKFNFDDSRYMEDKEGFKPCEFWSLDYSLACYIYSHLCYFKEHCLVGNPAYLTFEQWEDILNKMIKAFRLYIQKDDYKSDSIEERKRVSKNKQKQIKYGMQLFIKYFHDLWF